MTCATLYRSRTLRLVIAVALAMAITPWIADAQDAAQSDAPNNAQHAQQKAIRPTQKVDAKSCATANCHGDVKDHKVLHGPVNVNACDACHTLDNAAKHTFKPSREGAKLCTFCHDTTTGDMKVVHKPMQTGDCLACHNPHGGFDRFSLRQKTMQDLCKSCHQDVVGDNKHVHGPVAAGACGACHLPHASNNDHLLVATGNKLCAGCHAEMTEQLKEVKFVHKALEKDCQSCHDPHASNYTMMIHDAPLKLCTTECHQEVKTAVFDAKYKHSAVTTDFACINCHTAHGSDLKALMKASPVGTCLQCHAKELETPTGEVIASVAEIADPKLVKHGPVAEGSCNGCHNVHGSDETRLLRKPYPETFYESFKLERFDLCFSCHDAQLVQLPKTEGLTNFRNGEVNLHYLHVNKAKRGRTCRACHSTHASTHELHVRESVPYGNWEMPINFKKTNSGGSCAPGCHQALGYDRNNPVDLNKPIDKE